MFNMSVPNASKINTPFYYAGLIVLLLFVLSGAALWSGADHSARDIQSGSEHHPYVDGVFFDELAEAATHTHFDGMANLLSHLAEQTRFAEMQTAEDLALLDAIVRPLVAHEAPPSSVARVRLLLEKSLPDQRGLRLGSLLEGYLCYVRQRDALHRRTMDTTRTASRPGEPQSLAHQRQEYIREVASREACLGAEVSRVLFAEQDRLTHHLLQRRETLLQHSAASNPLVDVPADGPAREVGNGQ